MVTLGAFALEAGGGTAHMVILPIPPVAIQPGCDACRCDLDGVVAGVDIGTGGGCVLSRSVGEYITTLSNSGDVISLVPLCPVPTECTDAGVQNATEILRAVYPDWTQPTGHSWRVCSLGDAGSNECDPTADPTRDNVLAFATVFAVQCVAIVLGRVVMMWKLRRMVAAHRKDKRRAMADPRLEQRARSFVADSKAREARERKEGPVTETKLSARARFRRAGTPPPHCRP